MARQQNLTYSRISGKRYEEEEEEGDCVDHFCSFVDSKNDCTPTYTSFFSQSSRGIMAISAILSNNQICISASAFPTLAVDFVNPLLMGMPLKHSEGGASTSSSNLALFSKKLR